MPFPQDGPTHRYVWRTTPHLRYVIICLRCGLDSDDPDDVVSVRCPYCGPHKPGEADPREGPDGE
jgi:hypothetical protein